MKILIAGGGTGGHVFVGLAIAEALKKQNKNTQILFVGTKNGLEATKVPQSGFNINYIDISGLKGKNIVHIAKTLLKMPKIIWQTLKILKNFKPDAVVGVGGYASGPAVLLASLMGIETYIAEQNSVPGLTNKILSKFVKNIFGAFENSKQYFNEKKFVLTGNPIREEFSIIANIAKHRHCEQSEAIHAIYKVDCHVAFAPRNDENYTNILILGGSLGARKINQIVPLVINKLAQKYSLQVLHQTGKNDVEIVKHMYLAGNTSLAMTKVTAFIDNMPKEMAEADIVISRAGATTCFELMAIGAATIFIPYPYAIYDHQTKNAEELVNNHAAFMIKEANLSQESLSQELELLINNVHQREIIKINAAKMAKVDAAKQIAQLVLK